MANTIYKNKRFVVTVIALFIFTSVIGTFHVDRSNAQANNEAVKANIKVDFPMMEQSYDGWILKWEKGYSQPRSEEFKVVQADPENRLLVVQLHDDVQAEEWYREWIKREGITYVEPNYKLKINSQPNDVHLSKQTYLKQIKAQEGWDIEKGNTTITIAILDTGVDLTHPDLQANLVPGINLIDSEKEPQDENGHGTQIAGVLGAVGNNEVGVSGLLWSSKLMPVKVLNDAGEGSPFTVSQGIYESIKKGVSIILLSSGYPGFSQTLKDAVEFAEQSKVLVIAATGNEGARVNYPAAFPTVVAVGAVNSKDEPVSYSNSGPEVTVVAPGSVYSTKPDGKYGSFAGTSMAAPQVAGLAALIMKKFPQLEPVEVRNHLMYTSDDIHQQGRDSKTGYGRINNLRALQTEPVADIFEPNESITDAAPFPIETMTRQELGSSEDIDWYKIQTPYHGKIRVQVKLDKAKENGVDLTLFPEGQRGKSILYNIKKERLIEIKVPKGNSFIRLKYNHNEQQTSPLKYEMNNTFTIYEDEQQPNHTKKEATKLTGKDVVVGTFHRDRESDWFYYDALKKGQIEILLTTDTLRLDPVILFERPDETTQTIDDGNIYNGQDERFVTQVEPGRHVLKLTHYYGDQVDGEYYLTLKYKPYFKEPNESNNTKETATTIEPSKPLKANITPQADVDWYVVETKKDSYVHFNVFELPSQAGLMVKVYSADQKLIVSKKQKQNEKKFSLKARLAPGKYYVVVSGDQEIPFDSYKIQVNPQELLSGYVDIKEHWAKQEIVKATQQGLVEGVGSYQFKPDAGMNRAAVATILHRMYGFPTSAKKVSYSDLSEKHWAYSMIQHASLAEAMQGYPDGTFRPQASLTRAEAVAVFDRLLQDQGIAPSTKSPYSDVNKDHWAYDSILRLAALGMIQGYQDETFRPEQKMTRAEFVTLVNRMRKSTE